MADGRLELHEVEPQRAVAGDRQVRLDLHALDVVLARHDDLDKLGPTIYASKTVGQERSGRC